MDFFSLSLNILAYHRDFIKKMYLAGKIGHSHTPFENLHKGFPSDIGKEVKQIAKMLVRKGLLILSKHNYGIGVSLNHKRLQEIKAIIEKVFSNTV